MSTLENRGLVEQHAQTGKYRLGFGLVHLAHAVTVGPDVTRQAQSGCEWLAKHSEETVTLSVLEGNESVTIDQILSTSTVASRSWLGRRTPLHCTAPGKVFLAHLDDDAREAIVGRTHVRFTEHTIVDPGALRDELEKVRVNGYATTFEEFEEGLAAAAAPVFGADNVVIAAIGLSGPSYRLDTTEINNAGGLVRDAAAMASMGRDDSQTPE
nr:IclR family transcriptional regulator [Phytoactinopolyspora alkaliphila]